MFAVELKVENYHCENCHKVATKVAWETVVQLRQRVDHKRTFYLLEQMILKHRAHGQVTQVKEVPDGIDFYFTEHRHSQKLVNFIMSMVPCRVKAGGGRVISQDFKNNSAKSRNAVSLELVPICKDDIFILHPRQHSSLGGMGPLCLCVSVGAALKIVDVHRGMTNDLRPDAYFRFPRKALASVRHAITYTVLDVEKSGYEFDRFALAEVTVARSSDLGANDEQFVCMSHLGHLLSAGDEVPCSRLALVLAVRHRLPCRAVVGAAPAPVPCCRGCTWAHCARALRTATNLTGRCWGTI
jgi:nonsense-mediated mRNA decay protein 3